MTYLQKKHSQKGFTIVELMIATLVFSLILVAAMAGLVQISRLYYRGVTQARTQEVARSILEEVTQSIQFSNEAVEVQGSFVNGPVVPVGDNAEGFFCIGTKRYTYAIDRQVKADPDTADNPKDIRHALWVDTLEGGCSVSSVSGATLTAENPTPEGRGLLSENMRLTDLEVSRINGNDDFWRVRVAVAYGDDDTLGLNDSGTRRICEPGGPGIEFCAIAELETTVYRRVQ